MATLITFNGSCADEMDFNSHLICGPQDLENLNKIRSFSTKQLKATGDIYVGLGSNEENEYDNAYDLFSELSIFEITDEEAQVIQKYFGSDQGAANIDCILENIIELVESSIDNDDEDEDEE